MSRQNSVYRRMTAVCDQVADAALRGVGAAELAIVFSQAIRKTVLLLDPDFSLSTHACSDGVPDVAPDWDPAAAGMAQLLQVLAAERRALRVPPVPGSALSHGCLAMPVTAGGTALGYLLVLDETGAAAPDDADLIITSYAATLFALTLAREQTTQELGLRYQGTIVDSLVCGHFLDVQDARRKARNLGIGDTQPFRVAVACLRADHAAGDITQELDEEAAQRLMSELATASQSPFVLRGSELVMIITEPPDARPGAGTPPSGREAPLAALGRLVAEHPAKADITCGVSEPLDLAEEAPSALRQAWQAIELGIRLGRAGQLICYEDLGIYRLLLQIGDMNQLWRFAEDVLGPLIGYDATHKVDLIGTLSAYLSQHESLKQTARVLRVHVNTVAYRVQRIEQLTSLDLAHPDDRLVAHVAVKIIASQGASGVPSRQRLHSRAV
ncbi:MAG TPA: helix-turn-helix domain-containing protein [Streptosporangiaceae bacterium]|jgi:sugar diacid utilization regulator